MQEITEEVDLRPLVQKYPRARKVTVDMTSRTAYVFGSGLRATVVTGAEFDELVKALPASDESQGAPADKAGQTDTAGKPVEVEPIEAVITVVKEEPDVKEAAPKKRGK